MTEELALEEVETWEWPPLEGMDLQKTATVGWEKVAHLEQTAHMTISQR